VLIVLEEIRDELAGDRPTGLRRAAKRPAA
jgi:hypothetical protein